MTVNILGADYAVVVKKYKDDESFERRNIEGYCDGYAKEIVVCEAATFPGYEHDGTETLIPYQKAALRHEVVHAFLFESGLAQNSDSVEAWAQHEEMVDWIAWQGPKIYAAWQKVGAL